MNSQLLHGSGPEGIAGGNQHPELVLQQPEADFGQVGGLAHAVDAAERHHVGSAVGLALHHVPDDVNSALRSQQLQQGLRQGLLQKECCYIQRKAA